MKEWYIMSLKRKNLTSIVFAHWLCEKKQVKENQIDEEKFIKRIFLLMAKRISFVWQKIIKSDKESLLMCKRFIDFHWKCQVGLTLSKQHERSKVEKIPTHAKQIV